MFLHQFSCWEAIQDMWGVKYFQELSQIKGGEGGMLKWNIFILSRCWMYKWQYLCVKVYLLCWESALQEILLKLALITIKQTKISSICLRFVKSCFIHFQVLLFLMRRNCNFPQNSINVSFFINFVSVHINGMFKGNRRTRRKPPTCLKSLTNVITTCCTPRPDRYFNLQHQWW
jgi:hypothetical protein